VLRAPHLLQRRAAEASAPRLVRRAASERWCEAALAAVAADQPHVALVVGEPGAGKTRLLRELGAAAVAREVSVHVGRGWEGSSLPFAPLRQVLLEALGKRRRSHKKEAVDIDRHALQLLVRGEGPRSAPVPVRTLMTENAHLASSAAHAILEWAHAGPTMLVLDDLQWVDHSTLEAFEVLAFALADAHTAGEALPLLLVGGLRPPTAESRVARTLARLRREAVCDVLPLTGFDEDEMAELLTALGVGPATHQMVAMIQEATGGNPLFAEEVVRHLQRLGAVKREGRFFSMAPGEIHVPIPADVRQALTARAADLDAAPRDLLTLGAVLGDPFDLDTLARITKVERSALNAHLDAWISAALVVSDGARAQFAHPLVRQGLLAEIPSSRRQRLHAEMAEGLASLERRGDDDRQLEIAHHLVAAGPVADAARVVSECMRAGALAGARHAWTEAARFYEAALAAAERQPRLLSVSQRADLHYRAGFAHYRDQDAGACLAQFDAAIAAARAARDQVVLARALLGKIRARFTLVSVSYGELIPTDDLESVLDRIAKREPVLAAFGWSEMAQVLWTARRTDEARRFAQRALKAATRRQSAMVAAEAHRALSLICSQELAPQAALEHLESGLAWARRGHEHWIESQILQRMILPLLWRGQTDRLAAVGAAAALSTQQIHDWGDHSLAQGGLTCWAVARGDFEAAERHAQESLRLLRRSGYPWAGPTVLPALALARALRGAWADAEEALALLVQPGEVFDEPGPDIMSIAFLLGEILRAWHTPAERPNVRARFESMIPQLAAAARRDIYALGLVTAAVDCAELTGAPLIAAPVYEILADAHGRGLVVTTGWVSSVARVLGVAAGLTERWDEAARWFDEAMQSTRTMGARAEELRTAVSYAALLERRAGAGDRARALDLLALAVPQLRDLGMSPHLAVATTLAARLANAAPPASAARRARRPSAIPPHEPLLAIMFTDIAGSTAVFDRLGDAAGLAMVRIHDVVVREWLGRCDGTLMKHTGDGILAAFPSVHSALDCAVAMQRAFARHTRRNPRRPLQVRIGINVGEPLAENGDLFGTAVNTAARVCARAKGGETLITEAVYRLADRMSDRCRPRGRVTLRGLRSPIRLFQVA
jgi:class 3 adenylate cyclase/tetratricopeptide (TPR) repeat protein